MHPKTASCECSAQCGDDERVAKGSVRPCADYRRARGSRYAKLQAQAAPSHEAPPAPPPAPECACFPGACRGGEVINGLTAIGHACKRAVP